MRHDFVQSPRQQVRLTVSKQTPYLVAYAQVSRYLQTIDRVALSGRQSPKMWRQIPPNEDFDALILRRENTNEIESSAG